MGRHSAFPGIAEKLGDLLVKSIELCVYFGNLSLGRLDRDGARLEVLHGTHHYLPISSQLKLRGIVVNGGQESTHTPKAEVKASKA